MKASTRVKAHPRARTAIRGSTPLSPLALRDGTDRRWNRHWFTVLRHSYDDLCAPSRRLAKCILLAVILSAGSAPLSASAGDGGRPPPPTVASVDLDRYLGVWYEIASIPNRFQRHCRGNTLAEYRREQAGRIEVLNSCLDDEGNIDTAQGVARVTGGSDNAKLEVSFVSVLGWRLFWGDYWILDLAPDYSHAVVGTPNYRYGWILSRTPTVSVELRSKLDDRLRALGYSPTEFHDTPQGLLTTQLQPGAE
jgi:apolipoprotein D and lipocalin family protein